MLESTHSTNMATTAQTDTKTKRPGRKVIPDKRVTVGARLTPSTAQKISNVADQYFNGSQRALIETALEKLFAELSLPSGDLQSS
jgi:hypothetical protein